MSRTCVPTKEAKEIPHECVPLMMTGEGRAQLRSLAKFLSDEPVAIAYAPATQRESLGDDDAERRVSPARRRAESLA